MMMARLMARMGVEVVCRRRWIYAAAIIVIWRLAIEHD